MGAFITFLYLVHGKKNFFVLAPNRTIYSKLITDFTPNTPKYVFKGIGEFAGGKVEIITGDTFDKEASLAGAYDIHINVFKSNVDKINKEARSSVNPANQEFFGIHWTELAFPYLASLKISYFSWMNHIGIEPRLGRRQLTN